ncbi:MAG: hypothetical protein HY235_25185 [Acidobacteria bacterium]|nr:hypothetical protein [Acidobacteriota bacterium]
MKLGAEPKKVAILGGLLLISGYFVYVNVLSGPDLPAVAKKAAAKSGGPRAQPGPRVSGLAQSPSAGDRNSPIQTRRGQSRSIGEYRPSLKPDRPEDRPDPMKVDPTLRLDLLTRLQNVTMEGGSRTLFDFGAAPSPRTPDPKIIPGVLARKDQGKDAAQTGEAKPAEPSKPPPPSIPLKFYGFSSPRTGGAKRAFFLEGEEIHVASEGELIKRRYKIVRIGVNSVVVEDTEHKHQQVFTLEEPPATG